MTEPKAAPKKKRKYYRSPLDKLVSNADFTAKDIAAKMGISYDRMVALRRIKEIEKTDLELCKRAIEGLIQGNYEPLQEVVQKAPKNSFNGDSPELVVEEFDLEMQKEHELFCKIASRLAEEQFRRPMDLPERMAATSFLLGKAWAMLAGVIHAAPVPESFIQEARQLNMDIEKLLYAQ